jgi:hypothetical protein
MVERLDVLGDSPSYFDAPNAIRSRPTSNGNDASKIVSFPGLHSSWILLPTRSGFIATAVMGICPPRVSELDSAEENDSTTGQVPKRAVRQECSAQNGPMYEGG